MQFNVSNMFLKVIKGCFIVGAIFIGLISSSKQDTVTQAAASQDRADVRLTRFIHLAATKAGEPSVRPAGRNFNDVTNVSLSLNLIEILSFDEHTGVVQAIGWLIQSWKDKNINWSPTRFGGLRSISLPVDPFWVPDIKLYNSRTGKTDFDQSVRVVVSNDGTIMWVPPLKMDSQCQKLQNGTWICQWKFGSWTYNSQQVSLGQSPTLDIQYIKSFGRGWTPYAPQARRNTTKYPCCPETYQDVVFQVSLKQQST